MRAALSAAMLVALSAGGCKRSAASADDECGGVAPTCYEALAENCCAEAGVPAECGPKDAPRGTHLKWVCPGKSVRVGECAAYGLACATHIDQVAPTLATPHAVPLGGDPSAALPPGWMDASAGAVLVDRTEALSAFYTLRRYSTRAAGPEPVKEHQDLYFGKDRLTEKRYLLAPAGDYVLFEDGAGKNVLHGAVSAKRRDATPRPYEPPTNAAWDIPKRTVVVSFAKHAPMTVRLP